jgi:hypothetical protein
MVRERQLKEKIMRMVALFSALALGAMTSVALAAAPVDQKGRVELTDRQLDGAKGGAPCSNGAQNPNCSLKNPGGQTGGCNNNGGTQCTYHFKNR